MHTVKLNFDVVNYFSSIFVLKWEQGTHDYVCAVNGNSGLNNRHIADPHVHSYFFDLDFVKILNSTNLKISSVSTYKLSGRHDGKLCRHTHETSESLYSLAILHGSDTITWNIHDTSATEEYYVQDQETRLYNYIKPGDENLPSNFLSASQVPIVESYTNTAIIVDNSLPQSFTNESGIGYVTIVIFTNQTGEVLKNAFKDYV